MYGAVLSRIGTTLAVGLSLSLALVAAMPTSPADAGTRKVRCYQGANLQTAINRARAGDTLIVSGTCVGQFTIHRDLRLQGAGSKATLRGTKDAVKPIVHVGPRADVKIIDLRLTGNGDTSDRPDVGGVHNEGDLRLVRSRVTDNIGYSPGILNEGRLWLDRSRMARNEAKVAASEPASLSGGRVWVSRSVILAMASGIQVDKLVVRDSVIEAGNEKSVVSAREKVTLVRTSLGGDTFFGPMLDAPDVTLIDSEITLPASGGVDGFQAGSLEMRGSTIQGGGGQRCAVAVGRAKISNSKITDSVSTGLCIGRDAIVVDSVIRDNHRGILNDGDMRIFRSRIADNGRPDQGGGIKNTGKLRAHRVKIHGNTADAGGGIHNTGTVDLTKVRMWNNEPNNCTGC